MREKEQKTRGQKIDKWPQAGTWLITSHKLGEENEIKLIQNVEKRKQQIK